MPPHPMTPRKCAVRSSGRTDGSAVQGPAGMIVLAASLMSSLRHSPSALRPTEHLSAAAHQAAQPMSCFGFGLQCPHAGQ